MLFRSEREARERASYQRQQQAENERRSHQGSHSQDSKREKESNYKEEDPQKQDPYKVLGVTRGMPKAEIRKAYLKCVSEYAPDKVAHLSAEFQKMAHEKCVAFNLAWEKIKNEK